MHIPLKKTAFPAGLLKYKYEKRTELTMPRVDADIDTELYDRLRMFIARGRGTLYCQQSQVIAEAIKEYLDRHERRVITRG